MTQSFFSTHECELLSRRLLSAQVEARITCFSDIDGFYNRASQRTPEAGANARDSDVETVMNILRVILGGLLQ